MAGKTIVELPTNSLLPSGYVSPVFVYQDSNDLHTYKVAWNTFLQYIYNYCIDATESNITISFENNKIVFRGGSDAQKWYFSETQPQSANEGDLWFHTDSTNLGNIDEYSNEEEWVYITNARGADGEKGEDGITPHIDSITKHWMIGETDTNVIAEGQAGEQGEQGEKGDTGYSISASATPITGGTRITIHSTDPSVTDITFDVMNGNSGSYEQGNGISIAGNVISVKIGNGLQINSQTGNIDVVSQGSSISVSDQLTLSESSWVNKTQTVSFAHNTTHRNVVDITPSEMPVWAECGVYAISETSNDITFMCQTVPSQNLTFKVTSMEVNT